MAHEAAKVPPEDLKPHLEGIAGCPEPLQLAHESLQISPEAFK